MTAPAARPRLEGLSGEPCPYLTIQETTVRLRCSTKAVRRYVGSGKLVAYRVGRRIAVVKLGTHIRIDSDDLAHDLAASRQETAPRS